MRFDSINHLDPKVALAPTTVANNANQVTSVIDTRGYSMVAFLITLGAIADVDATFTVTLKEGDTDTQADHTAVADAEIVGSESLASFDNTAADLCRKIGYTGAKRYVSLEIQPANNTGNAAIAVTALLSGASTSPTDNPPA